MIKLVTILVMARAEDYGTGDFLWCDCDCPMFQFKKSDEVYNPFCRFSGSGLDEDNMGILRNRSCLLAGEK